MDADRNVLAMHNVFAGYGEIEVLSDISLRVKQGEIVSILGANGAGKSTLLKTLFGIVKPYSGIIIFKDEEITGFSTIDRLNRNIAYVPEGRSNFPAMTVQENLEMGAYIRKDTGKLESEIDAVCERFPILQEKRNTAAGNLSGGQQQMLEIGMALMLKPSILFIDEPTLGLAPILVTEVFEVIQEINASGTTIVLVEQNAKRALEISTYAYVLELGTIRFEGQAESLAKNGEIIAAYLGER